MKIQRRLAVCGLALALAASLAACGDDDDDDSSSPSTEPSADETTTTTAAAAPASSVAFTEPADGATVKSPVTLKMSATNFTIEPAGTAVAGHGHFHVMVDTDCVAVGTIIPMDAQHNHYGKAQTEAMLELTPGEHSLCLQAGDGVHTATDLTNKIKITVQ